MRASFLLVIAVAVLVGLGVAVAVKQLGLLSTPTEPIKVVEPVPAPPPLPPPPQILVASRHLFPGDTIRSGDVRVRTVRPEELKDYEAGKAEYAAPVPEAMYYRVPNVLIEADSPVKRKHLEVVAKPEALPARLAPGTRAVNLSLPKTNSVGGLAGVGDWVDIYVTVDVGRTDTPARIPHTGLIVPAAQIVAKRNTLWTVFAALPSDEVDYTLATNPYRAGLLEYARSIGTISMVPVSDSERKKLDDKKKEALAEPAKATGILSLDDPMSPAMREERLRIQELSKGTGSIGPEDLRNVLNLQPLPTPEAIVLPPPPPPPTMVEVYTGAGKQTLSFPVAQKPVPMVIPAPPKPEYRFFAPPTAPKSGTPGPAGPLAPRPAL